VKARGDSRVENTEADRPSDAVLAAYHDAGHTIAARVIGNASTRIPGSVQSETRRTNVVLDDWLTFTAAGHAAERELVGRLGLRWRPMTSHVGYDLDSCYRRICENTGEDPGDWILLHWIRALGRATRLLTVRWSEVASLAELNWRSESGPSSPWTSVWHTRRAVKPRSRSHRWWSGLPTAGSRSEGPSTGERNRFHRQPT
jgi:hypothetical protein